MFSVFSLRHNNVYSASGFDQTRRLRMLRTKKALLSNEELYRRNWLLSTLIGSNLQTQTDGSEHRRAEDTEPSAAGPPVLLQK